ncbi:MAG TPA: hypothetical protein VG015_03410 [Candidatus Dormibacteraeota bacterium]|nr:hypothetical protein [Candidatus Dormibacteraeota bacterium]
MSDNTKAVTPIMAHLRNRGRHMPLMILVSGRDGADDLVEHH